MFLVSRFSLQDALELRHCMDPSLLMTALPPIAGLNEEDFSTVDKAVADETSI